MKKTFLFLAVLLSLAPAAFGQEPPTDREILDNSLSWGTDVDSGKVAIDPSLLYFYDPENRVLVVNSRATDQAAQEAGATIDDDGTWTMSDGQALRPLLGEVAIYLGDEPAELREAMGDIPETTLARVQLATQASALSLRGRWFHLCSNCRSCPYGCDGATTFSLGGTYRTCSFSFWPFHTCQETWRRDLCPGAIKYACKGCDGSITGFLPDGFRWGCGSGC
jgi:hypothetical protein